MAVDIFNIEPQTISRDASSYTMFLYGNPKSGKTSFVHELYGKKALFARTEKGTKLIPGLMGEDIAKWSDFTTLVRQLQNPKARELYDVVVIDTIDNLYMHIEKFIKNKYNEDDLIKANGGYGKAYKEITELLFEQFNKIEMAGFQLVFISHATRIPEKVSKDGKTVLEQEKYAPTVPKRAYELATKMVDSILFAYLTIDTDGNEKRVLHTRETLNWVAGTRFKNLPAEIELNARVFENELMSAIDSMGKENLKDTRECNYVQGDVLDFDSLMKEAKGIAVAMKKADKMSEVTKIVDKIFGEGAKLTEANPNQVEQVKMVVENLRELV